MTTPSHMPKHYEFVVKKPHKAAARIAELEAEAEINHKLIGRQSDLLTGVANALRGEPDEMRLHSHHDLPERAAALREAAQEVVDDWCSEPAGIDGKFNAMVRLAALLQEKGE